MSDNRLYNEFERSREAYWAHQEDQKALDALRVQMEAERVMAENVGEWKKKNAPV